MGHTSAGNRPIPWQLQIKGGIESRTMVGDEVFTGRSAQMQRLDPGGASRNIDLDDVADGMFWLFANAGGAGENLVIRDTADATIVTINPDESAIVGYTGSAYAVLMLTAHETALLLADVINEATAGLGVTVDGLRIRDAAVTPIAGGSQYVDITNVASGEGDILIADNLAIAWAVVQAANSFISVATTNGAEKTEFGQNIGRAATVRDLTHQTRWENRDELWPPPARASQTVTFDAADPTDEDTITVGGIVYLIQDTAAPGDFLYELDMSTTEATMATNFAEAINNTGTPGTNYSKGIAAHPDVSATRSGAVVTLTARAAGRAGNLITLAGGGSGATLGGATLEGGRDGRSLGWQLNSGSDSSALDPAPDLTQAGGVWQLVTGAGDGSTAQDGSGMVWADQPIQLDAAGGVTVVEFRMRIKTVITNVALQVGLTDDPLALEEAFTNAADVITSNATDGVAVLFDTGATTLEWFLLAVDSGVDDAGNATTTVAPVADAFQIVRLEISADGATISVFFDNAAVADLTLSADVGVGPDVPLYPYAICVGDGTLSKVADIDYCDLGAVR